MFTEHDVLTEGLITYATGLNAGDLTIGQEMRMFQPGLRNGQPEEGTPVRVKRIAESGVFLSFTQDSGDTVLVNLHTQRDVAGGFYWAYTLPQARRVTRFRTAYRTLISHRLQLLPQHRLTVGHLEVLVQLLEGFTQSVPTPAVCAEVPG